MAPSGNSCPPWPENPSLSSEAPLLASPASSCAKRGTRSSSSSSSSAAPPRCSSRERNSRLARGRSTRSRVRSSRRSPGAAPTACASSSCCSRNRSEAPSAPRPRWLRSTTRSRLSSSSSRTPPRPRPSRDLAPCLGRSMIQRAMRSGSPSGGLGRMERPGANGHGGDGEHAPGRARGRGAPSRTAAALRRRPRTR